ncbi:MAG: TolC family protein [Gemmatimonadota bacterium]
MRKRSQVVVVLALGAGLGHTHAGAAQEPQVLTLDQAIALALEVAPGMLDARSGRAQAGSTLLTSRGSWLPSLSLGGTYANSSNERFDQATGQLVSQNFSAQAQAGLTLFAGGRRFAQNRSAGAGVAAADADLIAERFQTILTTTQAYYDAAAAGELVKAAEQRLARAEQQLSFAQTRLEVGTATRSDALRAELERGNAQLAVLEANAGWRGAALQLGRRVGIEGEVRPAEAALPDRAPALPSAESLVAEALASSPIVLAAEATLRSRQADHLASYTGYLPSAQLAGGYDWFAFNFPPKERSWNLRLTVSLPVLNGFQREAALQRTEAAERAARGRAEDARIAARADVETAVLTIEAAEQRVRIADRSVELAQEDLRVQEERYQIGAATILDLQTSQVTLADAEISRVLARQALGTSVARLEAILGKRIGAR